MAGLKFTFTGDNQDVLKKINQIQTELKKVYNRKNTKIDLSAGIEFSLLGENFKRLDQQSREAFDNMSKDAQKYVKEIQENILSLQQVEKMQAGLNSLYEDGDIDLNAYIQSQARLTVLHEELAKGINESRAALESETTTTKIAADSIAGLHAKVLMLTTDYMNLSKAQREGTEGAALLKNLQETQTQLDNASLSMDKYASGAKTRFDALGFSITQIARELPSLAMGPQMFFLAISNNIGPFQDALAAARKEYQEMIAAGKTATPVWKQLLKSLTGTGPILAVLTTLFVAFGDKIFDWIGTSKKAEKTLKKLYTQLRDLNNVLSTSIEQSAGEVTKLNSLYKIATDVTKSTKERNNAVKELKRSYPEHLKNLSDESIKNGEVSKAIKEQTSQIIANAKATAAADQIAKNWYKSFQAGVSKNIAYITKQRLEQELVAKEATVQQLSQMRARPESYVGLSKDIEGIKEKIKETDREIAIQENLQDSYQKSSKALEKLVTVSGLGGKYEDTDKNYNSIVDQQNKIAELMDKQALEQKRSAEDMQMKIDEGRIKAMDEGSKKTIAEIELNFEKEMQAVDRQKEDLLRKKIDNARSIWEANPENKGKTFNATSISLSDSENQGFDEMYKIQIATFEKNLKEYQSLQKDAWNEYYIEYGKYQEKRMAIMEKYDKQIAKAEEGSAEKATLTAKRKKELDDLDKELLDSSELWSKFFTDFSNRSSSSIRSIIEDIQELIDYMNGVEGAQIPDIFKDNEKAVKAINDAMSNPAALKKFTSNLESSIKKFKKMLDEDNPFKQISEGFKTKDSEGISKGFQGIASAAKELTGILEGLGLESDSTAGKVTSVLGNTASYAATGASVGGPWGAVIGGAIGMATGLVGVLGADYSAYNKMKDEYASLIDVWDILINKKKEYVNISYGDEARKAGEEAIDLIGKKLQSNIELGIERLNSGASAGSHSIGVRIRKSMSNEGWRQWDEFAQSIGIDPDSIGGRLTGLFGLTAEQLSKLQEDAPTFWAKLDDDVKGYLQDIIDCNEEIENMKEQLKETMTGVSFDSFYDNFVSTLSDMDKDSQDFADDFENYLKNAILSNLVANKYRSKIEALYNDWANKSDSNGDGIFDLTSSEADELRKAQQALAEEMIAERDAMAEVFGWTSSASSQESSKKGFATMSQDSADELNGRFTALQISGEESKNQLVLLNQVTSALLSVNEAGNATLNNMLYQQVLTNSYLEDIAKYTKVLQEMNANILQVRNNTAALNTRR